MGSSLGPPVVLSNHDPGRRFMGSDLFLAELPSEHEPVPLTRPPGTLSPAPSGGEGRDEGVRFMERHRFFF
jgi:hypothetical protein